MEIKSLILSKLKSKYPNYDVKFTGIPIRLTDTTECVKMRCREHGFIIKSSSKRLLYVLCTPCVECVSEHKTRAAKANAKIGAHKRQPLQKGVFLKRLAKNNPSVQLLKGYKTLNTKAKFGCLDCTNIWKTTPQNVLSSKHGCPMCLGSGAQSKAGKEWLSRLASKFDVKIEPEKSFTVDGTTYRVDGYCKKSKTIYEFHGDVYHGNVYVHSLNSRCHPYSKSSAAKLFCETFIRMNELAKGGYTVVYVWESDYADGVLVSGTVQ